MPLLGGALTRFQAAYPVWARLAAGFMILFTGMCTGRIAIRYNLYGVSTCLPIPLYAVVACGIFSGGNYLTAFAASMLLALAAKNYCRSYCNGYGFDGVAMALIGQLHPLATIVVAIFFAALRVGSTTMQAATGVPTSVSDIIQALVIVFTVAGLAMVKLPGFKAFLGRLTERRKEAA